MLTTHAAGSATAPPTASCSFVFRVVDFIIDGSKKKKDLGNEKIQADLITSVANS